MAPGRYLRKAGVSIGTVLIAVSALIANAALSSSDVVVDGRARG